MMDEDTGVHMVERPMSKASIVNSFKVDVMRSKQVWIIANDGDECKILWNRVSPSTGNIELNKYSLTTFKKRNPKSLQQCENCPIFQQAAMDPTTSVPSCPHISVQSDIMEAISCEIGDTKSNEFTAFMRGRFQISKEINVVRQTDTRLTFLVTADYDKCIRKNIRRADSFVTFQRSGSDAILFCSNVECKRKKMSTKLKSPKDYCPHFEKVWCTPSVVDHIYTVIGIPVGCEAWGLGTGNELDIDGMHESEMMITSSSRSVDKDATETDKLWLKFDFHRSRYVPRSGVVSPIPYEPTERSVLWSERRKLGLDVIRDVDGGLQWNSSGFLIGKTSCDIDIGDGICPSCQVGKIRRERMSDFMLYTCIGCVIRPQFAGICDNLGEFSEYPKILKFPLLLHSFYLFNRSQSNDFVSSHIFLIHGYDPFTSDTS
jgi:hypothetical protein